MKHHRATTLCSTCRVGTSAWGCSGILETYSERYGVGDDASTRKVVVLTSNHAQCIQFNVCDACYYGVATATGEGMWSAAPSAFVVSVV